MSDVRRVRVQIEAATGFEPVYASAQAAGADLKAGIAEPITLQPGERVRVPTGVRCGLPAGYEGQVRPRSGLADRAGVTILNAPGTIDADYRGEIQVILVNLSQAPYQIQPGERVAQLVIAPVTRAEFEAGPLPESVRGSGGFGSTGR